MRRSRLRHCCFGVAVIGALAASLMAALPLTAQVGVPLSDCVPDDNGDPLVRDVMIEPSVIDVTEAGATVTIETTAMDTGGPGAASGVARVLGSLTRIPWGRNRKSLDFEQTAENTWTSEEHFAQGARPGSWRLSVTVIDRVGNRQTYSSSELRSQGLPGRLTVRSVYDRQPPDVVDLRTSVESVDTRDGPATVRISARLRDNLGINWAYVELGGTPVSQQYVDLDLREGTRQAGVWSGSFRLEPWAGSGDLMVERLYVRPMAGSYRSWETRELADRGFSTRIQVRSHSDSAPPTLTILSISPQAVDVTQEDAQVEIRVRAQDPGAGVDQVYVQRGREVGSEFVHTRQPLQRVSGTDNDGTWAGTFVVHHCERAPDDGILMAIDGNGRLSSSRLAEALAITYGDRRGPVATVDEANSDSSRVAVTFNEDAYGIGAGEMIVYTWDPDTPAFDYHTAVPGRWVCQDQVGGAVDCEQGPVRSAAFVSAKPLLARLEYWVKVNPEHHLGVRDLAGNAPRRYTVPGIDAD
jgi:hypothetical protein